MSKLFINNDLKIETQWRSLILFGKNSATYKFAFAQSLLELANNEKTVIKIEDLAIPFALHTVNHLRQNNKQGLSKDSKFLNSCRNYINNMLDFTGLFTLFD